MCPANLLLLFDCAGLQNLVGRGGCLLRLRSRSGAARLFGHGRHFSWQVQGKPRVLVVQSRLFVRGARGQSGATSKFQISWAQHFGYGGDLRRALIS